MRIAIMTDLEGVAGVIDSVNWCLFDGRYYEIAKELLTEEVNAAVRGFRSAGALEFHVIDGLGWNTHGDGPTSGRSASTARMTRSHSSASTPRPALSARTCAIPSPCT